jgi:glycosyltransferase involved in cell wall biosynthesis
MKKKRKIFSVFIPHIDKNSNSGQGLFQFVLYTFKDDELKVFTLSELKNNSDEFLLKSAKDFNIKLGIYPVKQNVSSKCFNILFYSKLLKYFLIKISILNKLFIKIIYLFFVIIKILLNIIRKYLSKLLFFIYKKIIILQNIKINTDNLVFLSPLNVPLNYKPSASDILVCADFLHIDFPETISHLVKEAIEARVIFLFSKFKRIVCFSDHVKNDHLINYFKVDPSKIYVIKHCLHDLSSLWGEKRFSKILSNEAHNHVMTEFRNFNLLNGNELLSSRFIITSSTYRANYKNFKIILDLINSGWLNKNHINLFLTHVPDEYKSVINKNGNVFFVNERIDNLSLAYLYSKATLALHTSLFEGGVNVAPFSEALSVGTPCVACRSKATSEARLNNLWLFDGDNLSSLTQALDLALINTENMLSDQISYYLNYEKKYNADYLKKSWDKLAI